MMHIQRFVERLQGADSRGSRDFSMSIKEAKDLHADITKLLLTLEILRNHAQTVDNEIVLDISGGTF